MKKVNSLYIEFDPVLNSQWAELYKVILDAMKKNHYRMIRWEVGLTDVEINKPFQLDVESDG